MEQEVRARKNRGGRPRKAVKQDQLIGVKCTTHEKYLLLGKAKSAGQTLSEFMREAGLNRQYVRRPKVFPLEVLRATGMLNHMAANLNQIARKRNQLDELNAWERASLQQLSEDIKQLAQSIKNYLQ